MKKLLLILLGITCYCISNAQITVNLGEDKTFCKTSNGTIINGRLGDNLTIIGSGGPYTYRWIAEEYIGLSIFRASYFLNDTTIANPKVENGSALPPIKFYLYVTDALGNQGVDSINVNFSQFGMIPPPNFSMTAGDTIPISLSFGGGTPPYTFLWSPNINISDVTVQEPEVWPTQTTDYSCAIIDALGCPFTFGSTLTVTVWPVNTNNILKENIKIYPNPTQDLLIIELAESQLKNIKMTDMSGKVVLQQLELLNNQVNISHLPLGVYVLTVEDEKGNIGQFQVLKE